MDQNATDQITTDKQNLLQLIKYPSVRIILDTDFWPKKQFWSLILVDQFFV